MLCSEIVLLSGLPPPHLLPPPNSLQTRICDSKRNPGIYLTPGSMLILTPEDNVFLNHICQFCVFFSLILVVFIKCIYIILWTTEVIKLRNPFAKNHPSSTIQNSKITKLPRIAFLTDIFGEKVFFWCQDQH